MTLYDAIACFAENVRVLDSQSDPIQWNLNNGLRMMCEQLRGMQSDLDHIKTVVDRLQSEIRARR